MKVPHRVSWSVAACVALAFGAPAFAQELQQEESTALQQLEGPASVQKKSTATYIVRLRENPAVAYDGDIKGLKATRPAKGKKIDPEAPDVVSYVSYLQARHDAVLAQHGGGRKLHSYGYAFNGFAARLNEKQAKALASNPAVVSVWKDEELHLNTNRTPAFLGLTAAGGLWEQLGGIGKAGEDVIIGMVDSGFWPESPSFSDRDAEGKLVYQNIPHWPGKCHPGEAFNASHCNQKVIGARHYNAGFGGDAAVKARYPSDFNSPRDGGSHGSHTASTAGGNSGVHALVRGTDLGVISGMAPRARLSIYKTCYGDGATSACFTSDSVAAIDQAVADGVDVLNYSISGSTTSNVDAVQVAFLFAVDAGVFVAASAGNSGPTVSTVAHNAPWMTTVAAGTHDRLYASGVTLGNGTSYSGVSVAGGTASLPTIRAQDAGLPGMPADQVAQCWSNETGGGTVTGAPPSPPSPAGPRLDAAKIAGKIVLCERGNNARVDKSDAVRNGGGLGMILGNVAGGSTTLDPDVHSVPTVHVQNTERAAIAAYITATSDPTSKLAPGVVTGGVVAPDVAGFSSRGPARASGGDVLKPDIMAPGVAVLAATSPATPGTHNEFDFFQGTSMAAPHIAGLAALFKQRHPDWSPAMIKSALMTTASQLRSNGTAIAGTPFDRGAGQVTPNKAVDPGLVYDASFNDWLKFLCGTKELAGCTPATTIDPSDLNYPSIAVGALIATQTVTRTVKNVGAAAATYSSALSGLAGINVTVSPPSFTIPAGGSQTYTMSFTRSTATMNAFTTGAITWSDTAGHAVRSPVAVKPVSVLNPVEVSSDGSPITYPVTFGYTGVLGHEMRGMLASTITSGTVQDDPADDFVLGGPGTVSFDMTIPSGTQVARFALFNDDMAGANDLDLYIYDAAGNLVGASTGETSNEMITFVGNFGAIPLKVVVHGFNTANGDPASFKLHTWMVRRVNAGNTTVTRPSTVTNGQTANITLAFPGIVAPGRYLGQLALHDGAFFFPGPTIISVKKP